MGRDYAVPCLQMISLSTGLNHMSQPETPDQCFQGSEATQVPGGKNTRDFTLSDLLNHVVSFCCHGVSMLYKLVDSLVRC